MRGALGDHSAAHCPRLVPCLTTFRSLPRGPLLTGAGTFRRHVRLPLSRRFPPMNSGALAPVALLRLTVTCRLMMFERMENTRGCAGWSIRAPVTSSERKRRLAPTSTPSAPPPRTSTPPPMVSDRSETSPVSKSRMLPPIVPREPAMPWRARNELPAVSVAFRPTRTRPCTTAPLASHVAPGGRTRSPATGPVTVPVQNGDFFGGFAAFGGFGGGFAAGIAPAKPARASVHNAAVRASAVRIGTSPWGEGRHAHRGTQRHFRLAAKG